MPVADPSTPRARPQPPLVTADGERLACWHRPGPEGSRAVAVVLAHGFGGGAVKPAMMGIADRLARQVGVLSFDFRGHGTSTGYSTAGDREVNDVNAAVAAARALGYARVVTIGFSMGGAAVLRHAGLSAEGTLAAPDAVVAVSAGSRWFQRDTPALRRLHWLLASRSGRLVARLAWHVRVDPRGWRAVPESPEEVVGRIAPVPLLIVHGDADHYFGLHHANALRAAARDPVELWVVPGFGHAEMAVPADLVDRIGRWVIARAAEAE
ncbi:MAG: alpha/beta hydrolase [Mycobacteriales bacterium]